MNEPQFSGITIKALMRLYQMHPIPMPDGRHWCGRVPFAPVGSKSIFYLSRDGAGWTVEGPCPESGDRLDYIMRMEQVSREKASEMLHSVLPEVLKREGIEESGSVRELRRDKEG